MKSITSTFLLLTLIGCSPAVLVTIVNETDIPRVDETVSVLLPRRLKGRNLSIKNSRGEQIPCQSIIEKNGEVIPVEVKATNSSTVSLNRFIDKYKPSVAYKLVSTKGGRVDTKLTIPHYMLMFV